VLGTLLGALIGALLGALTGTLLGALTGALLGTLLGALLGTLLGALALEIASGQYALAAIAANLLALAGFSEVFLVVSVWTTSDMSVPPLTLSHTHLPAPTAASGSEKLMSAALSEAMNESSVLSACAGTAMPIMAAKLARARSSFMAYRFSQSGSQPASRAAKPTASTPG